MLRVTKGFVAWARRHEPCKAWARVLEFPPNTLLKVAVEETAVRIWRRGKESYGLAGLLAITLDWIVGRLKDDGIQFVDPITSWGRLERALERRQVRFLLTGRVKALRNG